MEDRFKFRFYDIQNKIMIDEHSDYEKILDLYGTDELWWCVEYRLTTVFDIFDNRDFKIMQCTGLKDKNGKLIYEGDIVTDSHSPGKYQICWEQKYCRYFMKTNLENELYNDILDDTTDENSNHTLEVIGNIWENKDLLKEGKE